MTQNQIAYSKLREEARHNVAMEVETNRSNVAREQENSRANTLNYNASIYQAQASMYNAQLAADANRYSAMLNANTQRYVADTNASVQNYKTDTEHWNRRAEQNETVRHNIAMEQTQRKTAGANVLGKFGETLNNIAGVVKTATLFLAP